MIKSQKKAFISNNKTTRNMNLKSTKLNNSKKRMLEALEKSLGVVTSAAKTAGLDRSNHYQWLKEDAEYKQAYEQIQDVALDFAESRLHRQIDQGNTTATIFYLKTKGRNRGYVERHEHIVDERPIFEGIDLSLDDE